MAAHGDGSGRERGNQLAPSPRANSLQQIADLEVKACDEGDAFVEHVTGRLVSSQLAAQLCGDTNCPQTS